MSTTAESFGSGTGSNTTDLLSPLYANIGWIKFFAIVQLIGAILGVLASLGIYIIVMWMPIWLSVLLLQCAGQLEQARQTGNEPAIRTAMQKLGFFFKLQGIFMIVALCLGILAFLIALAVGITLPSTM